MPGETYYPTSTPDQLNIATPEQVDLRFPIAGLGSRFLAILADHTLQLLVYILLGVILYATSATTSIGHAVDRQSQTAQKWLAALFILLNFLIFWGYFALFEAFWNGQTPGKRLLKLRVLKDSGRAITLFEALARNLLRIVDLFPSLYLTGVISMLLTRENKRLGDLVAGTIVVHERSADQPLLAHMSRTFTTPLATAATPRFTPSARAAWLAHEATLPADSVARLTPADLHIIETFFARALDLPIEKREALAARIATQLTARMALTPAPEVPPERLLELIAHRMRATGRS